MLFTKSKITTALIAVLFSSSLYAATVYQWKDEQGNVHFGTVPPAGSVSQSVQMRTQRSSLQEQDNTASTQQQELIEEPSQAEIDEKIRKDAIAAENERRKLCTDLRTNLSTLKNYSRINAEVDGKVVRISQQERQKRIADTEEEIRKHCR